MTYQIIAQSRIRPWRERSWWRCGPMGFIRWSRARAACRECRICSAPEGVPVQVPEDEAGDATVLAAELLKEMAASGP